MKVNFYQLCVMVYVRSIRPGAVLNIIMNGVGAQGDPTLNLLCMPIVFILPVVPYLLRSAVSCLTESHHNRSVPWNVYLSDEILIQLKPHTKNMCETVFVSVWRLPQIGLSVIPSLKGSSFKWPCPVNRPVTSLVLLTICWVLRMQQPF
jgi:hypothetical protein